MATAGTLFYDLIPKVNSTALASAAKASATTAGAAMGQTLGAEAGKAAGPALASSSQSLEARAAELGTKVGSAIGRPLATALSPVGTAIQWAQGQFERLPPVVQSTLGAIPSVAVTAGKGLISAAETAVSATLTGFRKLGEGALTLVEAPFKAIGSTLSAFGINAPLAIGAAVGAIAKVGIGFDSMKEQALVAFDTMLGGAEKATSMFEELVDFAKRTPFEVPGLIALTKQMIAFGFTSEEVIPTLTAIGDAVAGLGGSQETLQRVVLAIGQIQTQGQVMSRQMNMLTMAGIPAWAILANQMHITTGELRDLVQKGAVPANTAIHDLLTGIETGTDGAAGKTVAFVGLMEKQSHTLAGLWSNFKDAFDEAMGKLFEPIIPALKVGIDSFINLLNLIPVGIENVKTATQPFFDWLGNVWQYQVLPRLGPAVEQIGAVWRDKVWPVIQAFWDRIKEFASWLLSFISDNIGPALDWLGSTFGPIFGALGDAFAQIMPPLMRLMDALGPVLLPILKLLGAAIIIVIDVLAWLITKIIQIAGPVIGALISALAWVFEAIKNVSDFLINTGRSAWEGLVALWQWVVDTAKAVWGDFTSSITYLWDTLVGAAQSVGAGVTSAWQGVVDFFTTVFTAIHDAAVWFYENGIKPAFEGVVTTAKYVIAILYTVLVAPFIILFNILKEPVLDFWHGVIEPAWDGIVTIVSGAVLALQTLWSFVAQWIDLYLVQPFGRLVEWISGVWEKIKAANSAAWAAISAAWVAVQGWIDQYIVAPLNWLWQQAQIIWGLFQQANAALWAAIQAAWAVVQGWIDQYIVQPFNWLLAQATIIWTNIQNWIATTIANIVAGWALITGWIDQHIVQPMTSLWNNTIIPVWQGIQNTIQTVWNFIRDNIFAPLGTFVTQTIPGWFQSALDGITTIWNGIKEAAAGPVRWVIDTVWNNGIVKAWNTIAGAIGLGSLPTVSVNFARGGIVPGRDTGYDYVPAMLRGGEGVLVPEATRMLGGSAGINAINRHAERRGYARGGVVGGVQHFQEGGVVDIFGSVAAGLQAFLSGWDPAAFVRDKFSGLIDSITSALGGNFYAQQIGAAGTKAVEAAINTLIDKVTSWWNSLTGYFQAMLVPVVSTTGAVLSNIPAGLSGNAAMAWIIAHESGGNPTAQNPYSTASGLFQMINGTWKAYGGSTPTAKQASVAEQTAVATNYVNARYGGWAGAQAFWQAHGWYDRGGVLPPGWTMAYNGTGHPELVLTREQAAMAAGGALIGSLTVAVPESASARDVVDEISFALRHARHGGLHARRYG